MMKICKHCKKKFKRKGRRDIFCSKECYKESKSRKDSWTKYNRKKGFNPYLTKVCKLCENEFKTRTEDNNIICKKCGNNRRCRNWRAKQNNCKNNFNDKQWIELLLNTKGYCAYCKEYIGIMKLTIEHKLNLCDAYDLNLKKEYKINDITFICKRCNSIKNGRRGSRKRCQ